MRGGACRYGGAIALLVAAAVLGCGGEAVVPSPVSTRVLDGDYDLDAQASFAGFRADVAAETDPEQRRSGEYILEQSLAMWGPLSIRDGVLRAGTAPLIQEFSLREAGAWTATSFRGKALWHEDVSDPGDASEIGIELRRDGDRLQLVLIDLDAGGAGAQEPIVYTRRRPPS